MTLGQRIRWIRKYRGLTQKELGKMLGYPDGQADVRIAQYESDARTPKAGTRNRLAECLGVSPLVFSLTISTSRTDFMQSIFWMELCGCDVADCFYEWEEMSRRYARGEISESDYLEWNLTCSSPDDPNK